MYSPKDDYGITLNISILYHHYYEYLMRYHCIMKTKWLLHSMFGKQMPLTFQEYQINNSESYSKTFYLGPCWLTLFHIPSHPLSLKNNRFDSCILQTSLIQILKVVFFSMASFVYKNHVNNIHSAVVELKVGKLF